MNLFLKFKRYFIISIMFILFIFGLIIIYFTNFDSDNFKPVYAASDKIEKNVENKKDKTEKEVEVIKEFYVDIKGEVVNPGVYLVNENTIVNDVINLAGGLNKYANTKCINLSMKVFESMVIYVYSNTETKELMNKTTTSTSNVCNSITNNAYININDNSNNTSTNSTTTKTIDSNTPTSEIININTADAKKLTELPGIGESKANDIIKYREENGGFKNIEELKNVSGIGNSTFEKLKSLITV